MMKCQNCGMPLSPINTPAVCPRCYTPLTANARGQDVAQMPFPSAAAVQTQMPFPPPSPSTYQWEQVSNPTPAPIATPPFMPAPLLQPGMMQSREQSSPIPLPSESQNTRRNIRAITARDSSTSFLGFVIAGLCVVTGGLLLIFVYFTGLSLPQSNSLSMNAITPVATQAIIPSSTTAAATPTVALSPTQSATFPGEQYIGNPQMASSINTTSAQPLQTASSFAVGQKIFVTFDIHPNGKSGAVCLAWYSNNHPVNQFAFPVSASAGAGYSYDIYGATGSAYVQISWASTTACSDALLAQQVSFTVTH